MRKNAARHVAATDVSSVPHRAMLAWVFAAMASRPIRMWQGWTGVDLSGQEWTFFCRKLLDRFQIYKEGRNTRGQGEKWKVKKFKVKSAKEPPFWGTLSCYTSFNGLIAAIRSSRRSTADSNRVLSSRSLFAISCGERGLCPDSFRCDVIPCTRARSTGLSSGHLAYRPSLSPPTHRGYTRSVLELVCPFRA